MKECGKESTDANFNHKPASFVFSSRYSFFLILSKCHTTFILYRIFLYIYFRSLPCFPSGIVLSIFWKFKKSTYTLLFFYFYSTKKIFFIFFFIFTSLPFLVIQLVAAKNFLLIPPFHFLPSPQKKKQKKYF